MIFFQLKMIFGHCIMMLNALYLSIQIDNPISSSVWDSLQLPLYGGYPLIYGCTYSYSVWPVDILLRGLLSNMKIIFASSNNYAVGV